MPRQRGVSEAEIRLRWEQVVFLTRRGLTAPVIAERLGVSTATVYRVRRLRDVHTMRQQRMRRFTAEEDALCRRMLEDGASYSEVARTVGRHREVINRRYPGLGWTRQQCGEWTTMIRKGLVI